MQHILDNLIERYQCKECLGLWFHFNYNGNNAFYRLSPLEPGDCTICAELDIAIEKDSLLTIENWVTVC